MKKLFIILFVFVSVYANTQTLNLNNNTIIVNSDSVTFTQDRVHVDTLSFPDGTYWSSADGRGIINVNNANYTMQNIDRTVSDSAYTHDDTIYLPANPTAEWLRTVIQTNGGSRYSVVCGNGHRIWLAWQFYKVDASHPTTFSFNAQRDKWEINSAYDVTMGVDTNTYPAAKGKLAAWYRSDSLITFSSSNVVSGWGDIEGTYDFSQSNVSYQPTLESVTNGSKTFDVVRFATDDYFTTALPANSGLYTIFIVAKGGGGLFGYGSTSYPYVRYSNGVNGIGFSSYGYCSPFFNIVTDVQTTYNAVCFTYNSIESDLIINGTSVTTIPCVSGIGTNYLEVGHSPEGFFNGDLVDVLIYGGILSEAQEDINFNAFIDRYGTPTP